MFANNIINNGIHSDRIIFVYITLSWGKTLMETWKYIIIVNFKLSLIFCSQKQPKQVLYIIYIKLNSRVERFEFFWAFSYIKKKNK